MNGGGKVLANMHANVGLVTSRLVAFWEPHKRWMWHIILERVWTSLSTLDDFNKIHALNTYVVTSFFDFILVKEVNEKQVCYKHHFMADSVSCPENVDVFCHFTNAANNSVQSPSMKLHLVPGESTFNILK